MEESKNLSHSGEADGDIDGAFESRSVGGAAGFAGVDAVETVVGQPGGRGGGGDGGGWLGGMKRRGLGRARGGDLKGEGAALDQFLAGREGGGAMIVEILPGPGEAAE